MTRALPTDAPVARPPALMTRLSVMMFLQFAIQGAWLPLAFQYLDDHRPFESSSVAWLLAWGAIGAVVSPFIAGQLADRYMNAERFMAVAHIIGAAVVWVFGDAENYYLLAVLSFVYGVLYTPTLGTANAIAFAHLPDRERQFPVVRVFGTVGWILVCVGIGHWLLHKAGDNKAAQVAGMRDAFRLSTILGVVLGLYCLTLPKTPPKREAKSFAPGKALREIRYQPLITIFLISIPVAAAHQFFFVRTAQFLQHLNLNAPWIDRVFGVGGAGLMAIGQISELIVLLAVMPVLLKRVPRKTVLAIGLVAYTVRFFAFAYLPKAWALLPALALHGLVFGCFFFVCFLIIDEFTTKDVRSSAQNMFNLVVFGVGVIFGNLLAGWIDAWTKVGGETNWRAYYAIPGWVTAACLLALLLFYPRNARPLGAKPAPAAT